MKKIFITTEDGVKIAGEYFDRAGEKGVLLLHMMPATKESWGELPLKLRERGFKVLAIDLRGHGESTTRIDADVNADKRGWNIGENLRNNPRESASEKLDYQNFSDAEHQKSIKDVEVAVKFLEGKGVLSKNLVLIGASIGANLALEYMGEHLDAGRGVLLSAGLDYRGVMTEQYAKKLIAGQRVFFVASEDDGRAAGNAAEMNQKLYGLTSEGVDKKILLYKKSGHGTNMFGKEKPDLEPAILEWLQ